MYNVLVCDDEKDIVSALQIYLKSEGYQVFSAYNGKEALKIINREDIQLVLMDIMMPEMDGIEAMCKIREISNVPVILLTAKSEDTDKVLGLTVGADDYVTKPFNPVELQARVKSQIRRYMLLGSGQKVRTKLSAGGIELDDKLKEVTLDGEPVNLTRTEYDILKLLMEHPGEVYSRSLRDIAYKAMQAKERLAKNAQKEPTLEEIAAECEIPVEDVVYALDAIQTPLSLFDPVYTDGGDTLYVMDQISDKKNKEEHWVEDLSLSDALSHLNERDEHIIRLRFFEGKTQIEVADEIHISQAQVSRLEKNALKSMQGYLRT